LFKIASDLILGFEIIKDLVLTVYLEIKKEVIEPSIIRL
jgi:hypothetical protein